MHTNIYIHTYIHTYIYIYIYSDLEREYPPHVYKHFQYTGPDTLEPGVDDFYSPVNPHNYIVLRWVRKRESEREGEGGRGGL